MAAELTRRPDKGPHEGWFIYFVTELSNGSSISSNVSLIKGGPPPPLMQRQLVASKAHPWQEVNHKTFNHM
jgi:hypothetical protein